MREPKKMSGSPTNQTRSCSNPSLGESADPRNCYDGSGAPGSLVGTIFSRGQEGWRDDQK